MNQANGLNYDGSPSLKQSSEIAGLSVVEGVDLNKDKDESKPEDLIHS